MLRMVASRKKKKKETLHTPPPTRIYVVGDVHGRIDLLNGVFDRIDRDLKERPTSRSFDVLLGDYIDRGPSSRQVIDRLIAREHERHVVCLKGNHETFVDHFLEDSAVLEDWQKFGALETLMSYGLKPPINVNSADIVALARDFAQALPPSHRAFLNSLKKSFVFGDYFFVHAGVRPGIPLAHQKEADLLWIREDFLLSEDDFGKIVVHGHTPVREPDIRSNRINIDTGAYATGKLTCLVLEHDGVMVLDT
jgi:serine/threonine protein phosphatase 1